jgi:DNA-binding winged helix-turn-helix (wHTH) protein/TolB-like protein
MDAVEPRAYIFDGYRIDLARRQVRGPDDAPLALSSRAYDALIYLIENRDRIVGKDDLMQAVWPHVVVEENNLNQAISSLRKALGDQRESPRYIVTIAGRGYRFVANVRDEFSDAAQEPGAATTLAATETAPVAHGNAATSEANVRAMPRTLTRRWVLGGFASAVAIGAGWALWPSLKSLRGRPQSIAVLPFQPLLETAGNDALEIGMADTLITRLSGLPGIVVAPFSSVRRYTNHSQDPLAAGRELGVAAVLESHIQVRPDRVRLSARLLEVDSGKALWAGRFDEGLSDFFAIQDALAQHVVDALEVELSADTRHRLKRHDTDDVEALQLYLKARFQWSLRTKEGFRHAIEFYEAALARDPNFALAAAGLADSWAVMGVFTMLPPAEAFQHARAAAERAVALDGELAEAQAALGHVLVQRDRDWTGGERQYRLALTLKPTYGQAVFWLANNHCYQGHMKEALEQGHFAQSLEPMSVAFAANVGMLEYFARDYAAARDRLTGLIEAAPQYPLARRFLARVLVAQGEARAALALLHGHEAEYAPGCLADLGRFLAADGQVEGARREITRLDVLGTQGFGVGYELSLIYAALGERDDALAALERGVDDGSQGIGFLNAEPGLDFIRNEPRFRAVSQKVGLG